jgi:hypothetical protein
LSGERPENMTADNFPTPGMKKGSANRLCLFSFPLLTASPASGTYLWAYGQKKAVTESSL